MSFRWIWLVRYYRLCYRPFVALLKKSNTTVCHLSYFPEKRHCIQNIRVSIRPPFLSNLCNKHSSEHTYIMASWVSVCATHKLLGQAAAMETTDRLQSGGVDNFWPVPDASIPPSLAVITPSSTHRRLQIFFNRCFFFCTRVET